MTTWSNSRACYSLSSVDPGKPTKHVYATWLSTIQIQMSFLEMSFCKSVVGINCNGNNTITWFDTSSVPYKHRGSFNVKDPMYIDFLESLWILVGAWLVLGLVVVDWIFWRNRWRIVRLRCRKGSRLVDDVETKAPQLTTGDFWISRVKEYWHRCWTNERLLMQLWTKTIISITLKLILFLIFSCGASTIRLQIIIEITDRTVISCWL